MPACGLRPGSGGGPVQPSFISSSSRPSRGAKPHGADDRELPQEKPHQSGSRGGGDQGRGTSRGVRDASYDDRGQAGAGLRSVLVSSLVQRGQAQARSTKASRKGYHFGAMIPTPAKRQDEGHRGAQDGVIASAFGSRRPTLVRITSTSCSPSKWPLLAPFPLNIWEEDRDL